MTDDLILHLLRGVVHPETNQNLIEGAMIEQLSSSSEKIQFTIALPRSRDPFAASLKRSCEEVLRSGLPQFEGVISILLKEPAPKPKAQKSRSTNDLSTIGQIIGVSSAKGGVGKSTVTANLAVALSKMGYRVGVLDADLYGPSQPTLFGVEGYQPVPVEGSEVGKEQILPALSHGVKVMSIGFFIAPEDALIWRGPMASNALKQMIHQSGWGALDFLLIDMPPGTGDIHLSLISELQMSGAVVVSTPQKVALADVRRGLSLFRNDKLNIPILGLVENMAWFTPAELPDNRYYIFGEGGARVLAQEEGIPLLAEIPLIQRVRESADEGAPIALGDSLAASYYTALAENLVAQIARK